MTLILIGLASLLAMLSIAWFMGRLIDKKNAQPRFCKDCRWCDVEYEKQEPTYWKCRSLKFGKRDKADLVAGKIIKANKYCEESREWSGRCGSSGKYWEAKE